MGIDAMGGGDAPLHVEKTGKQADFLASSCELFWEN